MTGLARPRATPHRAHRLLAAFAIAVAASASGPGLAADSRAPDAGTLVEEMSRAMRMLDYEGSLAYQHAGRVDTLRIFHAGGARERERLISLNGPRTELIRDGLNLTCIQADGSAIVYASSSGRGLLPLVPNAASGGVGDNYVMSIIGSDRVAGYLADIVDIVARDRYRYGYRLWIDQGSRLLLRSIVTDGERRPIEQVMFVSLDIGTPPSLTNLAPANLDMLTTTTAPLADVLVRGTPYWRVETPPPGYRFVSARRPRQGAAGAEHLVYTDGLATVSVYVEPRGDSASAIDTMATRGTLNVFTRFDGDWRITVLGDVPAATVGAIGQSVVRQAID